MSLLPPRGISNPASFCYCNSVLQQLFRLPILRKHILSFEDADLLEEQYSILRELKNIFVQLAVSDEEAVDPLLLAYTILDPRPYDDSDDDDDDHDNNSFEPIVKPPRTLDPDLEMDVSEFLSTFLTQLSTAEERLATHRCSRLMRPLIQGQILNEHYQLPSNTDSGTLTGRVTLSTSVDQFFYISLNVGEVPNRSWMQDTTTTDTGSNDSKRRPCVVLNTLEQSLAYFCSEERINCAWSAVTREGKGLTDGVSPSTCFRSTLVGDALPAHLLVHLKRFRFDHRKRKRIKLHDRLEFPMLLDVAAFTSDASAAATTTAPTKTTTGITEDVYSVSSSSSSSSTLPMLYELSGVIVHRGSASKGHYYSLVRNSHQTGVLDGHNDGGDVASIDSDEWFKIDDAHVTVFDHVSDMDAVAFGGIQTPGSSSNNSKANDENCESQPGDDINDGEGDDQPPPKAKKQNAFMLFYNRIDTSHSLPCS